MRVGIECSYNNLCPGDCQSVAGFSSARCRGRPTGADSGFSFMSSLVYDSDVVVVGAGFIGAEVAATCRRRHLDVTVLEMREGRFEFVDNAGTRRMGTRRLIASATVFGGKRV